MILEVVRWAVYIRNILVLNTNIAEMNLGVSILMYQHVGLAAHKLRITCTKGTCQKHTAHKQLVRSKGYRRYLQRGYDNHLGIKNHCCASQSLFCPSIRI
jgi:hypothetical protein